MYIIYSSSIKNKFFRFKKRYSYVTHDKLFRIDITAIKSSPKGRFLNQYKYSRTFKESGVLQSNELFELEISSKKLEEYVLQLGTDCPFFIDNTPKYVEGIGEKMTSIDLNLSRFEIRLINPEIHISAAEAYGGITPQIPKTNLLDLINQPMENWKGKIKNDFEKSIFEKHPKLQSIKQQLYKDGAIYASMSGSGSTLYGFFVK